MKKKEFIVVNTTSLISDVLEITHEHLIDQVEKTIAEMNVLGGRGIYNPDLYFRKPRRKNDFIYGDIGQGYELSELGVLLIMSVAAPLRFRIKSFNMFKSDTVKELRANDELNDRIDEYFNNIKTQNN